MLVCLCQEEPHSAKVQVTMKSKLLVMLVSNVGNMVTLKWVLKFMKAQLQKLLLQVHLVLRITGNLNLLVL